MNDHGFSVSSPNGNYMLDTKAPEMPQEEKRCEVCGIKVKILYPTKFDIGELMLCQDCRDKFELDQEKGEE
jgi:hypothetical protein